MGDSDYFGRTLAGLKALGVTLSIDDFGTGYSSLGYLQRFPVDFGQDRSCVRRRTRDRSAQHRPRRSWRIVAMAGALDLDVIAEGVEILRSWSILRGLGVIRAQGFYLARPMPAEQISELISNGHRFPVDT